MSRIIVKKSRIHGNGVFAQKVYEKGEVVKDGHIRFQHKFRGYNHSCRPNVVLARIDCGCLLAVVTRKVLPGHELTVGYGRFGDHPPRRFKCNCSVCRRKK